MTNETKPEETVIQNKRETSWQEFAALGYWSRIEVRHVESEKDRADLRWALGMVLPGETTKIGFRDREITPQDLPALLLHINRGAYENALQKVRNKLASDADLDSAEKEAKLREARQLAERYNAKGKLPSPVDPDTAWRLEQISFAQLILRELEALGGDMTPSADDWLHQAIDIAKGAFRDAGLLWSDAFGSTDPDYECLEHIFVNRTHKETSSIVNESKVAWEMKKVPPLEESRSRPNEETDEPVSGSLVDPVKQKKRVEKIRRLESKGWFPLAALADPNHQLFETALGHAISIIRLVDEARTLVKLVEYPGAYSPDKETVTRHMFEISAISFEVGRHVQASATTEHIYHSRRREKQISDLLKSNARPKGSRSKETQARLEFMKKRIAKQTENGGERNVSAAAQAAVDAGLGSDKRANSRLFYNAEKASKK